MMGNKKSILFICYYFPPISSIAIWRNYFLALEAEKYFKEVYVFTTSNHRMFPNLDLDLSRFNIKILPTYDYRTLKKSSGPRLNYSEKTKSGYFTQLGIKLLNSFPVTLVIGEGGLFYIINGFLQGKRLVKQGEINHIYSSYRTMADHFIAFLLKTKYPHLYWTADFRDLPFDLLYKNYVCRSLQEWSLRKLLKKANLVTTFSKGLAKGLKKYSEAKIQVLPNGLFNNEDIQITTTNSNKFTIQYTGSLFLEERHPSLLFKVVRELMDDGIIEEHYFLICYAGKDGQKWLENIRKYNLENVSSIAGIVDSGMVRSLQTNAHINLLLTSSHKEYQGIFTGKFFEYLAAKRPILALINGVKDEELEAVFRNYNLGHISYLTQDNSLALKDFITNAYSKWKLTGKLLWQFSPLVNEDFNWEKTGKKWIELIS